ncbi:Ig-like domain-containing protein, partial [Pseudomonas monteilii]|uniref:Ig-like domain-containing protein n=1 Tax=Pseudomonas monteilii TaxID=76759 RepID=UPI00211EF192
MDNIVVADKQSEVATQSAWGNINLKAPSVVQIPVSPDKVATVTQRGQDLIVTLKSGEKVTVGNFFAADQAGVGSDMVFVGEDGTLWHAQYDAAAFTGFTFEEVASLDELVAGIGTAGSAMPTWAIAGLSLLGVGGAAAAAGNGGGGSSGGSAPDTSAPATPIDLLVSPDGLLLTGRGEAGTTVNIRDAAGNLIGSGTVGPDGNFNVTLNAPQINSENLDVTLTDAAGNVSAPGTVTAPDATAPLAPTNLAINEQGTTLTDLAEPGSTGSVRGAGGALLGTAVAGADGQFSITLQPPQSDGQALKVSAADAAGNISPVASITAPDVDNPDTTAPAQPTDLALADGVTFTGRGEPGATVQVRDAAGSLIGSGVVGADGLFSLTLSPAQANGEALDVRLVDAAGNASAPLQFDAPDITPPDAVNNITVGAGGLALSGRGEPGATVEVRDANGTVIGTGVVGANGTFLIDLSPAAQPGGQLSLVQTDPSGNASSALQYEVPVTTAPASPSDLVFAEDGSSISGSAPAGSRVEVHDANGTLIGSVVAGPDGSFTVPLAPPQVNGEVLQVTAPDAAGNTSPASDITAPDIDGGDTTPPDAATNLVVGLAGAQLNGRGEAGASVQVRDAQGNVLASGSVNPDGTFQITLDPPVKDGSNLQVVLIDASGNASAPASVVTPDLQPPAQPTNLALADGVTLSGNGEPGATVQAFDASGNLLGTGLVNDTGSFSITLSPAQANGEVLDIRLTDTDGNVSLPLQFDAPDITVPAVVSNIVVGADGLTLGGRGEAGATVEVRDANGTLLGTSTVTANGTFLIDLDPAALPGERLTLVQTDPGGNVSEALTYDVPLVITPTSPSELVVAADGSSISGSAPTGSRVDVHDANGTLIGSIVVGAEGTFTVVLTPAQANGELLDVVAIDNNGTSSLPVQITAPDITAPAAPNDLAISGDGTVVSGRAEAGSTVRVLAADGTTVLGSVVVGASGAFSIDLTPPQLAGEQLQVTATDTAGNASTAGSVTAPNVDNGGDTTPPEPATDLAISNDGRTVSGRGEAGATVEVRNDEGQVLVSGTVQPDGSFNVQLPTPVVDGSSLQVTLTDAAGNISASVPLTAPDQIAPLQPTDLVLSNGDSLVGTAEGGARVEVKDASGNLIGSAIAEPDGSFSLTLDPPQANGETLSITVTDAAGNTSVPLSYVAPDITVPAIITDVVAGDGSLALSGRGEPGATVEVRDAQGAVIGTGTVAPNGTFVVDLEAPLAAGENLVLVQTDAAGNTSAGVSVTVADTPLPESPSGVLVTGDGTSISGSAPAGTQVQVRDAQGNVLGSVQAEPDGSFTIGLTPAQANGEILDVVAVDGAGNSSLPTQITAPDITPPNEASELQLSADGGLLTGRGEPGTTAQVISADGTVLGSAQVGAGGVISVVLNPPQTDGQELDVVLRDPAGNTSTVTIVAPDIDGPLQPSGLAIDTAGIHLTGQGQSGSIVTVRDADGNVLGSATVGGDGRFDVTLNAPQRNGESLTVEATDNLGNSAGPVDFTAPDSTPPQVVTNPAIDGTGTTITGNGEPGATVTVRGPDGSVLGSMVVGAGGAFEITLDTPQTNGQALTVEQRDVAGNLSAAVDLSAPDTQAPESPTALVLAGDGSSLSGSGEPGAQVTVTGTGGAVLGTATVQPDGTFQVAIDPPQLNGQTLSVTQADNSGNGSPAGTVTAPDFEAPLPAQGLGLDPTGTLLSGQGEAGSTVEVRNAAGDLLGTMPVNADGTFEVVLSPAQTNGEVLSVVLIDGGGNASPSATFTADDSTAPAAPADLTITPAGNAIQGTGEAGSTVEVKLGDGTLVGTIVVPAGGSFTVPLSPAQLDGQALDVTLTDAAGNISQPSPILAPDITPPALPTDVAVSSDGTAVSGNAPGASSVTVSDGAGNVITVAVNPDGSFNVPLDTPQNNGQTVTVVVTDAAGNDSAPVSVTAPDTTNPEPATGLTVSPDGSTVGGTAEPGSTVEVRNPDDSVRGTVTVGPDGTFVILVDPPLASGETVDVAVIDP